MTIKEIKEKIDLPLNVKVDVSSFNFQSRKGKINYVKNLGSGKYDIEYQSTPYYTNSCWLPVNSDVISEDIWKALDLEDPLQTIPDGGVVQHLFLGEEIKDWRKVKDLIFKIFNNYKLPYLTISPIWSTCVNGHGYIPGNAHGVCPKCKELQLQEYQTQLIKLEKMLAGSGS